MSRGHRFVTTRFSRSYSPSNKQPPAANGLWALGQNIGVEMFLYHDQLAVGKPLSWAPLAPTGPWWNPLLFEFNGRTITLQGQLPWLLAPWLIYGGVIALSRKSVSDRA